MKYQVILVTIILPVFTVIFCNTESFAQDRIKIKKSVYTTTKAVDANILAQWTLQESYNETANDLKQKVAEVKRLNDKKKQIHKQLKSKKQIVNARMAIQDYKLELELFRTELILASANQFKRKYHAKQKTSSIMRNATVAKLIDTKAYLYSGLPTNIKTNIPNRIPRKHINSLASLDKEIAFWDTKLNTLGEDGQLFNIELQDALQNQQQTMQTMTNINKLMHDTTMAIIRKIKS